MWWLFVVYAYFQKAVLFLILHVQLPVFFRISRSLTGYFFVRPFKLNLLEINVWISVPNGACMGLSPLIFSDGTCCRWVDVYFNHNPKFVSYKRDVKTLSYGHSDKLTGIFNEGEKKVYKVNVLWCTFLPK